jgi:hypothetical protein
LNLGPSECEAEVSIKGFDLIYLEMTGTSQNYIHGEVKQ